jgi:hypothetical protein
MGKSTNIDVGDYGASVGKDMLTGGSGTDHDRTHAQAGAEGQEGRLIGRGLIASFASRRFKPVNGL